MRKALRYVFLLILLLALGFLIAYEFGWPPFQKADRFALDVADGGFLSQEPCGPPCFLGITPDITTEEDAIKTFQGRFDISHCDQWPKPGKHDEIACNPVIIEFNASGKVDYIIYTPSQPLTLGDAITKYGQPNAVHVLGQSNDNGGRTTSVTMLLFFDGIRTTIGLPEQSGTDYNVAQTTIVGGINYPGNDHWKGMRYNAQPWQGYGKYQGPAWGGP